MFSGDDVYRPSFFEMVAADRLVSSLAPSFHHLTEVFARRHSSLAFLRRCSEEIFAGLTFALERHYLDEHDASFSENFYGLRRVRVLKSRADAAQYSTELFGAEAVQAAQAAAGGGGEAAAQTTSIFRPLDANDRQRALFFLVTLPYLKAKLDALYLRWRDGVDRDGFPVVHDPAAHSAAYNAMRAIVLKFYPLFHALYEGSQFVSGLRFLFERSVFYSPWLGAACQVARRMNMEEMMSPGASAVAEAAAGVVEVVHAPGLVGLLRRLASSGGAWFSRYAKYLVLAAVCSFKFLEWWHSPANAYYNASSAAGRKLPIPPPPIAPKAAPGVVMPEDADCCALCGHERSNPAATPTGYVFCYTCIHQHISTHHACPVTRRPCTVEQLRKIYEN